MSARHTLTKDVDFHVGSSASPDEWREALDALEQSVPPEHRDNLVVSLSTGDSWGDSFVVVSAYYEYEETDEEHAARLAEEADDELRRCERILETYRASCQHIESRIAELKGGAR